MSGGGGRVTRWLFAIGLSLCGAPAAHAQGQPLAGVVRDSATGLPIAGAQLSVEGTDLRAQTGDDGAFRLLVPARAGLRLGVRRLGFHPRSVAVGAEPEVEVRLAAAAVSLPPVVVRAEQGRYSGRLAGYYERLSRRTTGQFITRADIDRDQPRTLTALLQRMPGIQLARRQGAYYIRMRGRQCAPLVWLDGAAMTSGEVDLDAFAPSSLQGIELYLGANSAPSRFQSVRGNSECGTILLWSRGPDTDPLRTRGVTAEQLEAMVREATVFTADQVDRPAVVDTTHPLLVEYPEALRASGTRGTVIAEFVVGAGGAVELDNVGIVGASDPLFGEAVKAALRGAIFRPAMRRGEAVRQLVRLPVEFQAPNGEPKRGADASPASG